MQRKYTLSADLFKISVYSLKNILYIDSHYYLLPYKNLIIVIGKLRKDFEKEKIIRRKYKEKTKKTRILAEAISIDCI